MPCQIKRAPRPHALDQEPQPSELDLSLRRLFLRSYEPGEKPTVLTADLSAENLSWLKAAFPATTIEACPKAQMLSGLERQFGATIADNAVHALSRATPALSASTVLNRSQAVALTCAALAVIGVSIRWPQTLSLVLAMLMSLGFVAGILFRVILAWIGGVADDVRKNTASIDATLPAYTILVPLYREARVLPRLVRALLLLDYPHDKLDIKLVVEADDVETVAMADVMAAHGPFEVVRVPPGHPRTKPRACNYAFAFARGEFTVIYDAEDRPERDQLRKAVSQFRNKPREVSCLQARLNFYNASENWLTRLFALDYALWFDVLLPGLERLRVPIPLGGTSNHFRTSALKSIGAWDPFNVTEDADLGVRMAQLGMRVVMLDSTTFEEAPTQLAAWLKQRSRWLKGYMQTWLVHMRDPRALQRRIGWRGLVAFQLFLGGTVIAGLVNPLLWMTFVISSSGQWPVHEMPTAQFSTTVSVVALFGGNMLMTWLALIAPTRRGWKGFAPYGLTVTVYWALISVAAWRGLWQLSTRPFHWDKTEHGLARRRRA